MIAALLDARLLDECEVDAAVGALAAEGLVPPRLLARARAHADATIADITSLPLRSVEIGRLTSAATTSGDVTTTYREAGTKVPSRGVGVLVLSDQRFLGCNGVCPAPTTDSRR